MPWVVCTPPIVMIRESGLTIIELELELEGRVSAADGPLQTPTVQNVEMHCIFYNRGLIALAFWKHEPLSLSNRSVAKQSCWQNIQSRNNQHMTQMLLPLLSYFVQPTFSGFTLCWTRSPKREPLGINEATYHRPDVPPVSLSLIHIWRCRRIERCRSRWSPYH